MKRSHDDDDEGVDGNGKASKLIEDSAASETIRDRPFWRFLIDKRHMGVIIGKGGSRIKAIRETASINASILKLKDGRDAEDRVMQLQGNPENVATAIKMICESMVEATQARQEKDGEGNSEMNKDEKAQIKLLVDKIQVGAIIGKGGAAIKKTQADTGVFMKCDNDTLPGSTEKACLISGDTNGVYQALTMVLQQLVDFPKRDQSGVMLYVPGNAAPSSYPHEMAQAPRHPAFAADPYNSQAWGAYQSSAQQPPYYPQQYHSQSSPVRTISSPSAPSTSAPSPSASSAAGAYGGGGGGEEEQKITIPTASAGAVIGKQGRTIKDIQAQTQTIMQISPVDTATPNERIVTLKGTTEGINQAVYMIQRVMNVERPQSFAPMGGGQAGQDYSQYARQYR